MCIFLVCGCSRPPSRVYSKSRNKHNQPSTQRLFLQIRHRHHRSNIPRTNTDYHLLQAGHWIAGACRVFWWQSFSFDNWVSSAVVTPGLPCSQPWGWSDIAGETAKIAKMNKPKISKMLLDHQMKKWSIWRALTSHDQLQREIEESINFHNKISYFFCNQVSRFPHSQPSIKVSDLKIWATWLTSASHAILDMATEVHSRTSFLFGYIFFNKRMF